MGTMKVAITLDKELLGELDRLVDRKCFANRSKAIQIAVAEKLERLRHVRLAQECGKLNPRQEQALAEEGIGRDAREWPEY